MAHIDNILVAVTTTTMHYIHSCHTQKWMGMYTAYKKKNNFLP